MEGITAEVEPDSTSHLFSRILLRIDPAKAGFNAGELAGMLAAQRPSIAVRSLMAGAGLLRLDLRRASDETADHIFATIERIAAGTPPGAAAYSLKGRNREGAPNVSLAIRGESAGSCEADEDHG